MSANHGAARAEEVLEFWFEGHEKDWFVKRAAFDEEIRARFLPLHEFAAAGGLAAWRAQARPCLALVIALDQFPRNMFRDTARAFATDSQAREAARVILERGWDRTMTESERLFAYLPFEHSESIDDQDLSCDLMKDFDPKLRDYAERHRDIIRRFGRFPHRNSLLGRESTAAEIEFLKMPGSRF
ncbi:MAG TPA: DUF924 family protein [Burkholderiales bacterium]|nr:DUF924 family protein [Burkholderiales bacterium]